MTYSETNKIAAVWSIRSTICLFSKAVHIIPGCSYLVWWLEFVACRWLNWFIVDIVYNIFSCSGCRKHHHSSVELYMLAHRLQSLRQVYTLVVITHWLLLHIGIYRRRMHFHSKTLIAQMLLAPALRLWTHNQLLFPLCYYHPHPPTLPLPPPTHTHIHHTHTHIR